MQFASVEEALGELKDGKLLILVDDEQRENEGDLVFAAEKADAEKIAFMAKEASGLVCVAIAKEIADRLNLGLVATPGGRFGSAFTISVDASRGISTGISAYDRAITIQTIADPASNDKGLVRPGHVFPLIAKNGGVLERAGHTEAAVDLMKLANLRPAGVICEIMKRNGEMARLPELRGFAEKHGLLMVSINDLIAYRMRKEKLVKKISTAEMPTAFGHFKAIGYANKINNEVYLALVKGSVAGEQNVLVRVHSGCLTGDVFFSKRCDCRQQLSKAMRLIEKEGRGVVLYIKHHEGRGVGLLNKLRAYHLQDKGKDTVEANHALGFPADLRDYGIGAQILADLGLSTIRLITNNPMKLVGLSGYGLSVVERVSLVVKPNEFNEKYLRTKREKLGHLIEWR
jgi:3,4-dihydroxy 2-butanone 4-phosphate synthase/GTP cyclohydrolase II